MPLELSCCPICGGQKTSLFDERQLNGVPVFNRLCASCGVVFLSPRLTASEAEEFHKHEYRRIHQEWKTTIDMREITIQRLRAEALLAIFSKTVPQVRNHLDIGCSGGLLMKAFGEFYKCKTTGVELDAMYRPYALDQGLQVFETLNELPGSVHYDVISMSHVLEHLPNPVEFLKVLRLDYLQPDGWLFLEVPNLYAHDSFEPGHLISYSSHALLQVLNMAGYAVEKLTRHGMPRSRIVPLYLNLIARPGSEEQSGIIPEKMVYLKRKSGRLMRKSAEFLLPRLARLPMP